MAGFDRAGAKAAGYTDEEIDAHLAGKSVPRDPSAGGFDRAGAKEAGYTDDEIDAYLTAKSEPVVSDAFMRRLDVGASYNSWLKVLGRTSEGAIKGWGTGELGFEPDTEMTKWLTEKGIFHDYSKGAYGGPITTFNEAILRPSAAVMDLVARSFKAGTHSLGALVGGIAEEGGLMGQGMSKRLERDVSTIGDVALTLSGALPYSPMMRTRVRPDGRVVDEPLGGFPRQEDFGKAARVIAEGENANVERKLIALYNEHGIHPAEIVSDVGDNPVLRQQLLSLDPTLPDEIVPRTQPGKGGKPPGEPPEPPKGPPPSDGPPALPPPERGPEFTKVGVEDSARLAKEDILKRLSIDERYRTDPITKERVYEALVDELFPLKKLAETAKETGIPLEAADNPYVLSRLYRGWAGKAEVMLKYEGTFDFFSLDNVGPSLTKILEPVKGDLDSFRAVLTSARTLELNRRGLKTGIDAGAAETVLRNATPAQKEAAALLYKYQENLAAYLRDSGVLSPRGFDAMRDANRYYVPFHALLDEEGLGIAAHGASLQPKNPIHRIKGSDYKKIDPLESIVKNTFVLTAMAERNAVTRATVNLLKGMEQGLAELKPAPGRELVPHEGARPGRIIAERGPEWDVPSEHVAARLHEADFPASDELAKFIAGAGERLSPHEIAVYEQGVRKVYEVGPDIARAIKALDRDSVNVFIKALSYPATTLKIGSVFTPEFWARHLWREQFYATTTYEKGGVYTPADSLRALQGMVIKDADYIDWLKGGGGHVSIMALDRAYLQENLRDLTQKTGLMNRAWNVVGHGIDAVSAATENVLSASHFGAFKKHLRQLEKEGPRVVPDEPWRADPDVYAPRLGKMLRSALPENMRGKDLRLREGVSTAEAVGAAMDLKWDASIGDFVEVTFKDTGEKRRIIEAAWTSRDTSVDNTRIGSQMHVMNMISAFANAKIQDVTRGTVEAFMRRGPETIFAVSAGIVLPSAVLWYANKDDSRVQSLPNWQRDFFWIIATNKWEPARPDDAAVRPRDQVRINADGQLEVNNGALIRLPKPFLLGVLFGTGTERLLDAYAKKKPDAFKGYFESLQESTVGDLVPNGLVPFLEQGFNRSRLGGQNLIPHHLEKLLPEYQYTPYTTETAKKMGMLISSIPGVHLATADLNRNAIGGAAAAVSSPILIENMVRGWTGTLGMTAFKTMDLALRKAGIVDDPPRAAGTLADVPFVRAFVARYPSMGVQQVQNFYDELGKLEVLKRSFDERVKQGDLAGMNRMMEIGGPGMFMKFDQMKEAIHKQTQTINMINVAPETVFKPQEKRQLIDTLYYVIQQIAEQGVTQMHEVKKALTN